MAEDRAEQLEAEVKILKEREKKLEHDVEVFRQIFEHMKKEFEKIKKK